MKNVLTVTESSFDEEKSLVKSAQQGDRHALETLMRLHQPWIYNIALRMTGSPHDAQDVTQEILVKVITRLSTFRGASSLRTWLYRIVANHVLNMRRRHREHLFSSFEKISMLLDRIPDLSPPGTMDFGVDTQSVVEETKLVSRVGHHPQYRPGGDRHVCTIRG